MADTPIAVFLKCLRNYMLHYKLPMLFQTPDLTGDAIQAKTILAAPQLLGWDGWRRAARTYLETAGPAVALHPVIEEYSMLTRDSINGSLPDSLSSTLKASQNSIILSRSSTVSLIMMHSEYRAMIQDNA